MKSKAVELRTSRITTDTGAIQKGKLIISRPTSHPYQRGVDVSLRVRQTQRAFDWILIIDGLRFATQELC